MSVPLFVSVADSTLTSDISCLRRSAPNLPGGDGKAFRQTACALDLTSRKAVLAGFLCQASGEDEPNDDQELPLVA
jgi:hypothetical protein